jgi:hypothetical protein
LVSNTAFYLKQTDWPGMDCYTSSSPLHLNSTRVSTYAMHTLTLNEA